MAASVVASRISKFISPVPLYHKLSENFYEAANRKSVRVEHQSNAGEPAFEGEEKYSSKIKNQSEREANQIKNL